jgi:hypothetical protein
MNRYRDTPEDEVRWENRLSANRERAELESDERGDAEVEAFRSRTKSGRPSDE